MLVLRKRVLSLQVFYIDFGNTETLSTTRLRADPICTEIPAQAFNCVLNNICWVCLYFCLCICFATYIYIK